MGITRRDFLMRVGQAGGYSAAFATMQSLGLMAATGEQVQPIQASAGIGKGVKVIVLGGGIGGLVTAYEMKKLGYDVILLEVRDRPGGRNWTARAGTKIEFVDGTTQTVNWEAGNYQNLGPARLPSTHWTMLEYAHELGVPMEVEVNTSRSTFLQNDKANGGAPMLQRKAINDTRGHVSELLAKSISGGALDAELTKEDRERMMAFLKVYGPLDPKGAYRGSPRAGYKAAPGAGTEDGVVEDPVDMHTLLDANFWQFMMTEETWDWQATMMQPVGGMDRIPYAFAKSLGPVVHYRAEVQAIGRTDKGVAVQYVQDGGKKQAEAAYCVIALPFEMLKKIPNDLSAEVKTVVEGSVPFGFYKTVWESRRFWERDYNIYGGLSYTLQGPGIVWYPSASLMSKTGILLSGYGEEVGSPLWNMSLEEKFAYSRAVVEKFHPGHGKELAKPVFCGWRRVKWNEGSWIRTFGGSDGYNTIIKNDGPFYFAGDTVSHIPGWQEGAALSARRAVSMISERIKMRSVPS
jgi:monoamine oxidase